MHPRSVLYKALNTVCHADITRVLLLDVNACDTQPAHPKVVCHRLGVAELESLVTDVDFRVSREFIKDYQDCGFFGIAAKLEDQLVGLLFLVSDHVAARHNSGGKVFNGIGLKIPAGVFYLFKVVVKPANRGERINAAMVAFAVEQLKSAGLDAIVTTTDCTNTSFLKSVEAMGFKRCGLASEFVIVGRHYYQLPAPLHASTGEPLDDNAETDAIRFLTAM